MSDPIPAASLPPGWECKYDHRLGRYYFINHFTQTTTWEDPRLRYRPFFPGAPQVVHSAAPITVLPQEVPLQDLTNVRPSPIPSRAYVPLHPIPSNAPPSPYQTSETVLNNDTEQSVSKISAMFPTVGETHIRELLKKYLKSVFPTVEETFLLDILCNADNNVQKATEKLLVLGFEKRDTPPPRLTIRKKEEELKAKTIVPTPPPRMKSQEEKQKMKGRLQEKYKDIPERVVTIALDSVDYDEERAGHILNMMVQEESKAKTTELKAPEKDGPLPESESSAPPQSSGPVTLTSSPTHKSVLVRKSQLDKTEKGQQHRRAKGKKDVPKVSRGTSTTEDKEHKSPYLSKVSGPNPDSHKGPNDELLLVDYVTWNGPNMSYIQNAAGKLSKGINLTLRHGPACLAKGPNKDICKGPVKNLAKGSIYCKTAA